MSLDAAERRSSRGRVTVSEVAEINSTVTQRRPSLCATAVVVPEPAKQSKTMLLAASVSDS